MMETSPFNTTKTAIIQAKLRYGNDCIVSGLHRSDLAGMGRRLDGAHIFPRSTHPELKNYAENILPLNQEAHLAFDWEKVDQLKRTPEKKLAWLQAFVKFEYYNQLVKQVERLGEILVKHGYTADGEQIGSLEDKGTYGT